MLVKLAEPKEIRHKEHTRYIKTNNPTSAYALHILNNRHEYGNAEQTTELLKSCNKGIKMNCRESFFLHIIQQQDVLIEEQSVNHLNALYDLAHRHKPIHYVTRCLLPVSDHFRQTY